MDPRLALRAAQLARPARRAALAAALRDARSCTRAGPQAPVDTDSVRACSSELTDLSRALTGSAPRVRGVAIARVLLTDGCSPLYRRGETDRLRNTLRTARSAL